MTHKKFITIALSVAIVHFILTSAVSHYIAVQVGSQIGQIVAAGLIEAGEKKTGNAEEEAKRIYQNMKAKSDEIKDRWKIPELLISLPAKPLMNPLLKDFRQIQINKLIAKEITRDQFRTQGLTIDYTANFLNSISFGFLVYIMLRIFNRYKSRR
jgi:hypothetical protein